MTPEGPGRAGTFPGAPPLRPPGRNSLLEGTGIGPSLLCGGGTPSDSRHPPRRPSSPRSILFSPCHPGPSGDTTLFPTVLTACTKAGVRSHAEKAVTIEGSKQHQNGGACKTQVNPVPTARGGDGKGDCPTEGAPASPSVGAEHSTYNFHVFPLEAGATGTAVQAPKPSTTSGLCLSLLCTGRFPEAGK